MTDISQKGLLPEYSSVVIDEAHNLTKSAYDQFKVEWDEQQVNYQLQTIDPRFLVQQDGIISFNQSVMLIPI